MLYGQISIAEIKLTALCIVFTATYELPDDPMTVIKRHPTCLQMTMPIRRRNGNFFDKFQTKEVFFSSSYSLISRAWFSFARTRVFCANLAMYLGMFAKPKWYECLGIINQSKTRILE